MYTETDLRDMLKASADRVPADMSSAASPPSPPSSPSLVQPAITPTARPPRRRRIVAPIAVAACTAAVITGVVALTQRPDADHTAPPAERTQSSTSHRSPQGRTTHSVPTTRATLTVPVVDEVRIDTRNSTENDVGAVDGGHGQQDVTSQIGHDRAVNLVIAPASSFDDRAVPRTHPVAIAGTTGHYAVLRLFPLSAGGRGGSAATGTVVFRTPDGHWAFAWLQAGTKNGTAEGTPVDDPSAIVHGFDTLHATFAAGTTRTPLRLGYLPAGAVFHDADIDTAHSRLIVASLTTESVGGQQMDVDVIARSSILDGPVTDGTTCIKVVGCTVRRHRDLPGGFELIVSGTNYSALETQRVLDHATVATDPDDPTTYFLLTEAVG